MANDGTGRGLLSWFGILVPSICTILVAIASVYQAVTIERVRSEVAMAQTAADVELRQRTFLSDQQTRRESNYAVYVRKLTGNDPHEQEEGAAMLVILYPSEAEGIIRTVQNIIQQRQPQPEPTRSSPTPAPTLQPPAPAPTPPSGQGTPVPVAPAPTPAPPTAEPVAAAAPALSAALQQAQVARRDTGSFAIVIGSDASLDAAQDEVRAAQSKNYTPVQVYLRGRWYATVIGNFDTAEQAQATLIGVRTRLRDSSFVVNVNEWCGTQKPDAGYVECSNS